MDQAAGVAEEEGSSNDTNVEAQDEQWIKRLNSDDDDEEEHSGGEEEDTFMTRDLSQGNIDNMKYHHSSSVELQFPSSLSFPVPPPDVDNSKSVRK